MKGNNCAVDKWWWKEKGWVCIEKKQW